MAEGSSKKYQQKAKERRIKNQSYLNTITNNQDGANQVSVVNSPERSQPLMGGGIAMIHGRQRQSIPNQFRSENQSPKQNSIEMESGSSEASSVRSSSQNISNKKNLNKIKKSGEQASRTFVQQNQMNSDKNLQQLLEQVEQEKFNFVPKQIAKDEIKNVYNKGKQLQKYNLKKVQSARPLLSGRIYQSKDFNLQKVDFSKFPPYAQELLGESKNIKRNIQSVNSSNMQSTPYISKQATPSEFQASFQQFSNQSQQRSHHKEARSEVLMDTILTLKKILEKEKS